MATFTRSSPSGPASRAALSAETRGALFDELSKIAAAELSPREQEKQKLKRMAKAGLLVTLGGAAGYGAGMLVEEGIKRTMGKKYTPTSPVVRKVLYPLTGALGVAAALARERQEREYRRAVEGDE